MAYTYYPGCSLKGLGRAYEESFMAVFESLGEDLQELDDWNCCGATAYMAIEEKNAFLLAARNLALAEKKGSQDIIAPCAGCYLVLNKAAKYLEEYGDVKEEILDALKHGGLEYAGKTKVRHPLDVILNDVGVDKLKEKIKNPLKGLKVACYYGCQIMRPFATFDDQDNPTSMDKIISATGADTVDYPLKTKCCGGSLTGTISEVGVQLCYNLLREIKRRGADIVVTACPLCQFNMESYQDKMKEEMNLPILHFTQVLGLAMGIPAKKLGLQRQVISPNAIFKQKGLNSSGSQHNAQAL